MVRILLLKDLLTTVIILWDRQNLLCRIQDGNLKEPNLEGIYTRLHNIEQGQESMENDLHRVEDTMNQHHQKHMQAAQQQHDEQMQALNSMLKFFNIGQSPQSPPY